MTHILLLALIFASLYLPAHQKKTQGPTPAAPGSDYDDYNEDEEGPPGNLAVAEATATASVPYFEQKQAEIYVQPNDTSVKLRCPVKNYDALHHVILWYKDEDLAPITNGNKPVSSVYSVDDQFALTVHPWTMEAGHSFTCSVVPPDVRLRTTIKSGPEHKEHDAGAGAPSLKGSSSLAYLALSALVAITMRHF